MPILPNRVQDLLDFLEQHTHLWAANAATIGLTAAQTAGFKTAATAARSAYAEQLAAVDAARAATLTAQSATREARAQCADLLKLIKAFALQQKDPSAVYAAAQIPAPAQPSPMPPPGQPTHVAAILEPDGSITLKWKAENPQGASGAVWTIRRKLPGEAAFSYLGVSGTKSYTDTSVPAGVTNVQYVIQGQRAARQGPASAPYTVLFGSASGELSIAAQFSGETRLAA